MRRLLIVGFYLFVGAVLAAVYNSPATRFAKTKKGTQQVDYSSSAYSPLMIPVTVITVGVLMAMMQIFNIYDYVYGILFPMFTELALYYALLILCAPLIRKKLRPKACAALWILPNLMYVAYTHPAYRVKPDRIISLNHHWALAIMLVWTVGFLVTLNWKIISHLKFRKSVLTKAMHVHNEEVLAIWKEELNASKAKVKENALMFSSNLSSPLAIGLFKRTIRVVLPEKEYDEHQLRLIFRHELVHLNKYDNQSKFFFAFCNALCWFNPLMWGAMKQCAEDLERSCDEAVLYESDDAQRKAYAELILDSQADQRGFTTCLSASAESLRYRLKSILKPNKLWSGGLILFAAVAVLAILTGRIAFAYHETQLNVDQFGPVLRAEVRKHYEDFTPDEVYECEADEELIEKLSSLPVSEISLMYKDAFRCEMCISMRFDGLSYSINMTETEGGVMMQVEYRHDSYVQKMYYCEGETLDSIQDLLKAKVIVD